MELFDLTPGDDFYKDKLATHHEEVMELWIARSRTACIKLKLRERVKKVIREGLTKRGFDPRVALTRMRMVKERILYLKSGFASRKKRKSARKQQQLYQLQPRKNLHVVLPPVQKDHVADLLLFDPKGSGMTRWEFLKDAMKRFELGEHSYTITDNGRLLACAWLRGKYSEPVGDLQGLSILPEAEVIHSVYYHPALKNWNQPFLNAVAEDVSVQLNKKGIYLVADAGNEIVSSISGPVTAPISGKDSYFQ
jgi:hypothetical protein